MQRKHLKAILPVKISVQKCKITKMLKIILCGKYFQTSCIIIITSSCDENHSMRLAAYVGNGIKFRVFFHFFTTCRSIDSSCPSTKELSWHVDTVSEYKPLPGMD